MPATALFNSLIRLSPETQRALAGYNGIVLSLHTAGLTLKARINADGLFHATTRPADTAITLHEGAWPKLLAGHPPAIADLAISGDTALGLNLLAALAPLPAGLGKRLDTPALRQTAGTAAEKLHTLLNRLTATAEPPVSHADLAQLAEQTAALAAQNTELQTALAELRTENAALRCDLEYLHARLDKFDRDW